MRSNNKGFTIIELVIVIAVIAILAGVMIPTFASVTDKAKESAARQQVEAAQSILLTLEDGQLDSEATYYFILNRGANDIRWYELEGGALKVATPVDAPATAVASDAVYAKNATIAKEVLTFEVDDPATDVNEATTKFKDNEDLANVIIWKKAN